eukprot:6608919-Pyramimonas_sp.AAC.1
MWLPIGWLAKTPPGEEALRKVVPGPPDQRHGELAPAQGSRASLRFLATRAPVGWSQGTPDQ